MNNIFRSLTTLMLAIVALTASAENPPGQDELFRIAYEGLKEKPNAWMPLVADRIIRVIEIRIPANPQEQIRADGKLSFVCELEVQELARDAKRLAREQARFDAEARLDGNSWRLTVALRHGDWEELSFVKLTEVEIAQLPTLQTAPLDRLYGEPYSPKPAGSPAFKNPLGTYLPRLMAVAAGDGSRPAEADVDKARSLLADYIQAFAGSRPDWARLRTAQQALARLFDTTNAPFVTDSRSIELKGVWVDVATAANQIMKTEIAAYRNRNGERRRQLERAIEEVFNAEAALSIRPGSNKVIDRLKEQVGELAYVVALAPGWRQTRWKTGHAQPREATLSEALEIGRKVLDRMRAEYEEQLATAISREISGLRQQYDGGYLDGVAALEKARALPEKSAAEASARYAKYETAVDSFSAMLRSLRGAIEKYPTVADREMGGVKIASLVSRITQQRSEARDGMDRLAIRVRNDAKAAYEEWVKSLTGDKKRIFDSAGRPSEARGDIWYYRSSRAGSWTTTIYTFRGDTLIGNRSIPWYE